MNDKECKLVKEQLRQAEVFKNNVITPWVKGVANRLIHQLHIILNDNLSGIKLTVAEDNVQNLCDIFENITVNNKQYANKENYNLFSAKYNNDMEPFNHLSKIHSIMDNLK